MQLEIELEVLYSLNFPGIFHSIIIIFSSGSIQASNKQTEDCKRHRHPVLNRYDSQLYSTIYSCWRRSSYRIVIVVSGLLFCNYALKGNPWKSTWIILYYTKLVISLSGWTGNPYHTTRVINMWRWWWNWFVVAAAGFINLKWHMEGIAEKFLLNSSLYGFSWKWCLYCEVNVLKSTGGNVCLYIYSI